MDRKWKSAAAVAGPALTNASDGYATDGNPGGGVPATVPGAHWYHMITEELLALITDASIAFDKTVLTQVRDAVRFLVASAAMPMSEMTFKLSNNGADATNSIDIAAGKCRSSDDTVNLNGGAMTKQVNNVWAAGSVAGGRCSGESLADGTWHIYSFKRTTGGAGIDYCFSQLTAPTLPDSATKSRRIGSWLREAGVMIPLVVDGDLFQRKATVMDVNTTNPGTSAITPTLSVPNGISVQALMNAMLTTSGVSSSAHFSDPATTDEASSESAAPLPQVRANATVSLAAAGGQLAIRTNTSRQVRYRLRASDGTVVFQVATKGWIDRRGRDG